MILFFLNWSLLSNLTGGGEDGSGELELSKATSPFTLFERDVSCSFRSSISRFSTSLISFWIRINPSCVGSWGKKSLFSKKQTACIDWSSSSVVLPMIRLQKIPNGKYLILVWGFFEIVISITTLQKVDKKFLLRYLPFLQKCCRGGNKSFEDNWLMDCIKKIRRIDDLTSN